MDRRIFQGIFTRSRPPQWPCPKCGKSILTISSQTFFQEEGADSKEAHEHDAWDPDWIETRFSCLLVCTNTSCKEVVACLGTGSVEEDYGFDPSGEPTLEYTEWFKPLFLHPSLIMMDIPAKTPDDIIGELKASFSLFYSSPNAAANSARMAIEALLTNLGVKRFSNSNGRRKPISLHHRIELLPAKYDSVKEVLKAVKWIGNHGSHAGKQVTTEALVDAYDLLEIALEDLYSKKRQRLENVAKAVNKRKGPRTKKKATTDSD